MAKSKQQIIDELRKEIGIGNLALQKLARWNLQLENKLKALREEPHPDNKDIYTCICGWHGTLDEMDAAGSKKGCCPRCGNESLPTIEEIVKAKIVLSNCENTIKMLRKHTYGTVKAAYCDETLALIEKALKGDVKDG